MAVTRLKRTLLIIGIISIFIYIGVVLFALPNRNEKIYPSKISIQGCPREIELVLGNYLVFNEIPYLLTPSNTNEQVKTEVLNSNYKSTDLAVFNNLTFRANETGTYYLKFSVKNRYDKVLADSIKIKVVEPESSSEGYIKVLTEMRSVLVNEIVDMSSMVATVNDNNLLDYCILGKQIASIYNFNTTGEYLVNVRLRKTGYSKCVDLTIRVKDKKEIELKLYDIYGKTIEDKDTITVKLKEKYLLLSFELSNAPSQEITIVINDSNLAWLESKDAPIINIQLLKTGECSIVFSYGEIVKTIYLIIE